MTAQFDLARRHVEVRERADEHARLVRVLQELLAVLGLFHFLVLILNLFDILLYCLEIVPSNNISRRFNVRILLVNAIKHTQFFSGVTARRILYHFNQVLHI